MLNGQEVLSQLKFDSELNIAKATKWSDEEISEMMDTYKQAHVVAKETHNTDLLLIINEKIAQLDQAMKLKKPLAKNSSISITQSPV